MPGPGLGSMAAGTQGRAGSLDVQLALPELAPFVPSLLVQVSLSPRQLRDGVKLTVLAS